MSANVTLKLDGAITLADVDAGFEVDLRVVGGPLALTLRSTKAVSLEALWDVIREQIEKCFGVSLPALDDGPWKEILDTQIQPSIWVTPDQQAGLSAFLDLDFQPPIKIGGSATYGPVTVVLEPDLTVRGLMIGYDAHSGLKLSASISYPTPGGKASKALTGGSPAAGEVNKVVDYPFPLPAQKGLDSFKVHYLGLGQRVGPNPITNPSVTDPLAAIFDQLESEFDTSDPTEILTRLANSFYHPDRGWFIAADIEYKTFRLRVLFNDPSLYGLEITVGDNPPNFFSGLLFEILYQKLGPKLGVYYGALTLPESLRRIPLDGFILILPGFSIWVYTNGDFRINIGWPVGPNSIGVSVDILTGWAGIYFAKLRSGDDPGAKPGIDFNPILEFGIGFQLAAGISLSAGPLSASLSVTATTTMQGLIAWKADEESIAGPPNAYWFAGTFSLRVLIQGSVNFVVIKASVTISYGFQAQVAFENGYRTLISVSAHVTAKVSIKVIFVTIHFSFSVEIHHDFTIGSGQAVASVSGPQEAGLLGLDATPAVDFLSDHLATISRLREALAPALRPFDDPLYPPSYLVMERDPLTAQSAAGLVEESTSAPVRPFIEVTFALQPTVVYDGKAQGTINVVGLLLTESPDPSGSPSTSPESGTGFESLVANLVCWLLNDYAQPSAPGEPLSARFLKLQTLLGQGDSPPQAPFNDAIGFGQALKAFFEASLSFDIKGSSTTDAPPFETGTILPMFDVLAMEIGDDSINFSELNPTPDNYAQAVSDYFDGLGLFGGQGQGLGDPELAVASPPSGPSVAQFVFADYYLLLMRQVIGDLLTAAIDYEKSHQKALHAAAPNQAEPPVADAGLFLAATDPQQELSALLQGYDYANAAGFAARFLLGGLQLPIPEGVPPLVTPESARLLPTEALYLLTGQQFPVSDPGSPPDLLATLTYPKGQEVSWITFGKGSDAQAAVDLPPSPPTPPAPQWLGLDVLSGARGEETGGDGTISYMALPSLAAVDLAYTLRNQQAWSSPSGSRVIVPFPAPLLALLTWRRDLSLSLHQGDKVFGQTVSETAPDGSATVALSFSLAVLQVEKSTVMDLGGSPGSPVPTPGGSPEDGASVPFVYQIGAASDEARERIYQAIDDGASIASVSILYPDSTGDGLVSEELAPDVLLVRTNLSTENQVKDLPSFFAERLAASPTEGSYAPLSDASAFLRLIWEESVVNADGYYLFYRTANGQGLPGYLFQDSALDTDKKGSQPVPGSSGLTASLMILVEFKPVGDETVPLAPPANSVVADAAIFGGKSVLLEVLGPGDKPIVSYHSAFEPGDFGFRLNWSGKGEGDGEVPSIPVDELYHLIQFRVSQVDGAPSPQTPAWSLPLSPLSPQTSGASPASPDPEEQLFQQVFPAYRFLDDIASPAPSPIASPGGGNCYDLVGHSLTYQFRLTDIFGNALAPQAQASQTGVYHDPIINLGHWPYTQSNHQFQSANGEAAELVIGLTFDRAVLDELSLSSASPGQGGEEAQLSALAKRYQQIAFQLADPGTAYSLGTSLSPSGLLVEDPRDELAAFVGRIRAEIDSVLASSLSSPHSPTSPITATLEASVPFADIGRLPDNITPVTVSLIAQRNPEQAAPDAKDLLPDVVSSTFHVPPAQPPDVVGSPASPVVTGTPAASAGAPKVNLAPYARTFEAAFENFDGSGGALKVAERAGVMADDPAQEVQTLWFVRFGGEGSGGPGIQADFTGALTYYALKPLSTKPKTQTVKGKTYNGIDMDLWAAEIFAAIDSLFEPQLSAAIALLDDQEGTNYFDDLSGAKQILASQVPTGLGLVLDGDDIGDLAAAQNNLRQALLDSLSSAYTLSVVAQAQADVEIGGQDDQGGSPAPYRPPELYGKVGVPSSGSPAVSPDVSGDGHTKVFTISSGRLNLTSGTQWVTLLVSVAQPDEHAELTLPLSYDIGYLQFDFDLDEAQGGYVPSSWIKFVLPDDPRLILPVTRENQSPSLRLAKIPIPLPFEPPVPALGGQRGVGASLAFSPTSPGDLSMLIAEALRWNYEVDLLSPLAAQDSLFFDVTFNKKEGEGRGQFLTASSLDALFAAMAEFIEAYPDFKKAIPDILASAFGRTSPASAEGSPGGPSAAIGTLTQLVANLAEAWPDRSLPQLESGFLGSEAETIEYQLRLLPNLTESQIEVVLDAKIASGQRPETWPDLRSANGALDWMPDPQKAEPHGKGWWQLTETIPDKGNLGPLTFIWADLDLRQRQSADFECFVVRNADLVSGRVTNTDFTYETDTVTFSTPLIPLITRSDLPVVVADLPLEDLLDQILSPLLSHGAELSPVLSFKADFNFALVSQKGGHSPIVADIPILILDDLSLGGLAVSPQSVALDLAQAIKEWHATFHGSRVGSLLSFAVTLFGVVDGQQLPLVQINPIRIDVSNVEPSWWL